MDRAFRWQQRAAQRSPQHHQTYTVPAASEPAPLLLPAGSPGQLSPYQSIGENIGGNIADFFKTRFACDELIKLWDDLWFGDSFDSSSTSQFSDIWRLRDTNSLTFLRQSDDLSKAQYPIPDTPVFGAARPPLPNGYASAEPGPLEQHVSQVFEQAGASASPQQAHAAGTGDFHGVGTWGHRQYLLSLPEGSTPAQAIIPTQAQQQRAPQHPALGASQEEEAAVAAAWRWRFTRKWHAEQLRALDPANASEADTNEEALQYLNAVGPAWNLHLPRTDSEGHTLGSHKSGMFSWGGTFGTSNLASELLLDDSFNGKRQPLSNMLGQESHASDMSKVAKRADQLLMEQSDLERQAQERWQELSSDRLWVGELLNAVEIDDWGQYRFVVATIKASQDRQKILLRGKNYCSEAQLSESINQQILAVARERELPVCDVRLVGGGIMEWRRDRDRLLHIHSGYTSGGAAPAAVMHVPDLLKLAAVLAKQSLPMHYKVSVDGWKVL